MKILSKKQLITLVITLLIIWLIPVSVKPVYADNCNVGTWRYCTNGNNPGCQLCYDPTHWGVCAEFDYSVNHHCTAPTPTSPPQPTATPIPPGSSSTIPNCTALAGPSTIVLGQSGTYVATFSSPQGNLGAEIVAGQNGVQKWNPCYTTGSFNESLCRISGTAGSAVSGPKSFTWTPTTVGTYDVFCRAWNDSIAECRGMQSYVDGPPRYLCSGPISSMSVNVVGPGTPTPTGNLLNPNSTCAKKSLGDANCDGAIDINDFILWKQEFDTMQPASPANQNANFACVEGNTQTYFVDLVSFEIWRRNATSGLITSTNPTPTITPGGPTLTPTVTPGGPTLTPVPPTSVPTSGPPPTNSPCTSNAQCGDGKDDPQNWFCDFSYTHQCYHEKGCVGIKC